MFKQCNIFYHNSLAIKTYVYGKIMIDLGTIFIFSISVKNVHRLITRNKKMEKKSFLGNKKEIYFQRFDRTSIEETIYWFPHIWLHIKLSSHVRQYTFMSGVLRMYVLSFVRCKFNDKSLSRFLLLLFHDFRNFFSLVFFNRYFLLSFFEHTFLLML